MKTHSTFDCGSSTASKKQTALDRLLSFNTNLTNLPLPVDATGNLHYLYVVLRFMLLLTNALHRQPFSSFFP